MNILILKWFLIRRLKMWLQIAIKLGLWIKSSWIHSALDPRKFTPTAAICSCKLPRTTKRSTNNNHDTLPRQIEILINTWINLTICSHYAANSRQEDKHFTFSELLSLSAPSPASVARQPSLPPLVSSQLVALSAPGRKMRKKSECREKNVVFNKRPLNMLKILIN